MSVVEMVCPKCGTSQPAAGACRKCGLLRARFADAAAQVAEVLVPPSEAAGALWAHAEADFAHVARHEAFVEHCRVAGHLPHAAARYRDARQRLGAAAEPAATLMIERIAKQSELLLRLDARPKERERTPRWIVAAVLSAVLVTAVVVLFVLLGRMEHRRTRGDADVGVPTPMKPPTAPVTPAPK